MHNKLNLSCDHHHCNPERRHDFWLGTHNCRAPPPPRGAAIGSQPKIDLCNVYKTIDSATPMLGGTFYKQK